MRTAPFKREGRNIWVSEGNSPTIGSNGNPSPDPRLPGCGVIDPDAQAMVVIPMASVISINESDFMVPCTSGVDYVFTKTATDVQYGVKNESLSGVATAGETFTVKANSPIGVQIYDVLQNPICADEYGNYKTDISQETPTIKCEGLIAIPVVFKTAGGKYDLKVGDNVCGDGAPAVAENPGAYVGMFRRLEKTEDIKYKVGKVLRVEDASTYNKGGLQFVNGDGLNVSSDSTKGFSPAVWDTFKKVNDTYSKKIVYIKITL